MKQPRPLAVAILFFFAALPAHAADEPALTGPDNCKIVDASPADKRRVTWSGPCKDGYADGNGTLVWYYKEQETVRYEGEIPAGRPDGQIYSIDRYGSQFEGKYVQGKREGKGIWVAKDGTRYEGDFKAGRFDGSGTIVYADGGRYSGQWKNGKFHGMGKARYLGGMMYEGEFIDNLRVGQAAPVAPSSEEFNYMEKDLRVSRMKARQSLWSDGIPFDKAYAQLSAAQQQAVREQYGLLHETDEPPFPANGLGAITAKVNRLLALEIPSGETTVRARVDLHGKADSVVVLNSPSPELGQAIALILMEETFKPGLCNGVACPMVYKYSLRVE